MNPIYDKLTKCYECFRSKINFTPKIALVLGSGLGNYASRIHVVSTLDYHDIDGFPVSTVPGHQADSFSVMWRMFLSYACRDAFIIMRAMRWRMSCSRFV
nr:hypothetical protein [Roseburia sp. AM59-24XD]